MRTRTISQKRRLAPQASNIVDKARLARKSLQRVTDLASARFTEVLNLDATGNSVFERRKLTEEERIERLQSALAWVQRAEDETRQLRAHIERALEREWKAL